MIFPDLLPGADEWLTAFWELSTDRQIGWAIGPLPASSIDRYCTLAGYDTAEAASFRGAMRAMDRVFREYVDRNADDPGTGVSSKRDNIQTRPMTPQLFDALFLSTAPKKKPN